MGNQVAGGAVQQLLVLFELREREGRQKLNAAFFQPEPVIDAQLIRRLKLKIGSEGIAVAAGEQVFPVGGRNFYETSGKANLRNQQMGGATEEQTEQYVFHVKVFTG